jgi:hypothetical protein
MGSNQGPLEGVLLKNLDCFGPCKGTSPHTILLTVRRTADEATKKHRKYKKYVKGTGGGGGMAIPSGTVLMTLLSDTSI